MRRREFIVFIGGAAAWPFAGQAQQGDRVRRIGVMGGGRRQLLAFRQALAGLGWTDGRNVQMIYPGGFGGDDINRIRARAQELVGSERAKLFPEPIAIRDARCCTAVPGMVTTKCSLAWRLTSPRRPPGESRCTLLVRSKFAEAHLTLVLSQSMISSAI